jgi:hypothetical protein
MQAQAATPGGGVGQSAGAGSPFNTYMAGVAIYVLIIGFLVAIMLIGGFLIVNLGLMSKRPEDHIGKRTPSDVGILKNNLWPEVPYLKNSLPAEEDDFDLQPETQPEKEKKKVA